MRRAVFVFVVLIAAAVAFEPLIHTHPLTQTPNAPCAVCVGAVGNVTALAASSSSPLIAVASVASPAVTTPVAHAYAQLSSRAPPAA